MEREVGVAAASRNSGVVWGWNFFP